MRPYTNFYTPYSYLLSSLMLDGIDERNARTGTVIRAGRGGYSFSLDLQDRRLPVCGIRKLFPKSAAAENAWYLQGMRNANFIRKYAPLWDKFLEPNGDVDAAYGYRWRHHFGRDQIGAAIASLKADPSNRRVVVSAWDPGFDGLGALGQKNVPCPAMFTLSMCGGELHSSLFIRSSDVFVGLPYDVMGHALLMDAIALSIGQSVELGVMHVTLAHPHIYESHWDMVKTAQFERPHYVMGPDLPRWCVEAIEEAPDAYVETVAALAKEVPWPAYSPKPEVIA